MDLLNPLDLRVFLEDDDVFEWLDEGGDVNTSFSLLGVALHYEHDQSTYEIYTANKVSRLLDRGAKLTKHEIHKDIFHMGALRYGRLANMFFEDPEFKLEPLDILIAVSYYPGRLDEESLLEAVRKCGGNIDSRDPHSYCLMREVLGHYATRVMRINVNEVDYLHGINNTVKILTRHGAVLWKPLSLETWELVLENSIRLGHDDILKVLLSQDVALEDVVRAVYTPDLDRFPLFRELNDYYVRRRMHDERSYVANISAECDRNKRCFIEGKDVDCDSGEFRYAKDYIKTIEYDDPASLEPLRNEQDDEVVKCPSGYCYNRGTLAKWFRTDNHTDPYTREQLDPQWKRTWGYR
jgi:hypothetical protein